MKTDSIAAALVHWPVLDRFGKTTATAITPIDVHDFARSCAFFGIRPVYIVHPSEGMHAMVREMLAYWTRGEGAKRNPSRGKALEQVHLVRDLDVLRQECGYRLWYTSARPPVESTVQPSALAGMTGRHLIVFGTGHGLDAESLPEPNGWLSPIEGEGMVRHLSVRAALAIYLDRLASRDASSLEA